MSETCKFDKFRGVPRIFMTGVSGQLGRELYTLFNGFGTIWAPTRRNLSLADTSTLKNAVREFAPNLIINCAAYTQVEQAESDAKNAFKINCDVPRVLAQEANTLSIPLIHYSTDYVFDGEKKTPYIEDDLPNPINVYGLSKLCGEKAIADAHDKFLIFRTSWLYHKDYGNNFYRTMLKLFLKNRVVKVVNDQIGAPTSAQYLANRTIDVCNFLGQRKISSSMWGIHHLCEKKFMSWHEFAQKIYAQESENFDFMTTDIIGVSSIEYGSAINRPKNSCLSSVNSDLALFNFSK